MIHTNRVVTVGDQESIIDKPIILYRGDREVEVEFELIGNEFMFSTNGNVIKSVNASHGQLVLNTPSGDNMFSELAECHDGKVVFVITKEMIDEFIEIGFYSFQIRLYDGEQMKSRVTIPPVFSGLDIRNPIAAEDETNVVGMAVVDYARIYRDQSNEELPTFDWQGNYVKTDWVHHDVITENKMNKIEDGLWTINNKISESDNVFLKKAEDMEKQRQNDVNKLNTKDTQLSNDIQNVNRNLSNSINTLRVDMEVADAGVKSELTSYVNNLNDEMDDRVSRIAINVKDFGAKCDGQTNDTAAINSAIEYINNNPHIKTLIISGDCVTDSINFTCNNVSIEGKGKLIPSKTVSIFITISGNNNKFKNIDIILPSTLATNIQLDVTGNHNIVEDCKIYHEVLTSETAMVWGKRNVRVSGNYNTIQHCEIFNGEGGMAISYKHNKVLYCYIHDNIVGINCGSNTRDCEIGHNVIHNNNPVYDSGADGILCTRNVSRMNIHHNSIQYSGEHGIYFQGDNSIITDNVVSFNAHCGIKIASYNDGLSWYEDETPMDPYIGHDNIIANNQCSNNSSRGTADSTAGIYLQASLDNIVVANNICNANSYGIRSVYTHNEWTNTNFIIDGNKCGDNVRTDMSIDAESGVQISNNTIKQQLNLAGPDERLNVGCVISNNRCGDIQLGRLIDSICSDNIMRELYVVSSCQRVALRNNTVTSQTRNLALDRCHDMDGCNINFVGSVLTIDANAAYNKRIRNCTFIFDSKPADVDYYISISRASEGFDFSNNRIEILYETWRVMLLRGDRVVMNDNIFICANVTENFLVLEANDSICNGNMSWNVARGINLKGNNNIACNNKASVNASSTYTGNVIANNLAGLMKDGDI